MTKPEDFFLTPHDLTKRNVVVTRDEDSGWPVLVIDRPHKAGDPKPEQQRYKMTPDAAVLVARQLAAMAYCSHGDGVPLEVNLSPATIERLAAAVHAGPAPVTIRTTKAIPPFLPQGPSAVVSRLVDEGKL